MILYCFFETYILKVLIKFKNDMCFLVLSIYLNQNILITEQKPDYELSGIYIAEIIKRWIEEQGKKH